MSQINDALKRAEAAQRPGPPLTDGPQFRPVGPEQAITRGIGLAVPVVLLVIALVGLLFAWQALQKKETQPQLVAEAKSAPAPIAAPKTKPVPPPAPTPAPAVTSSTTIKPPTPVKPVAPVAEQPKAPTPEPEPVALPPMPFFKLQMISFIPGHSSAMISGKTVKTGDVVTGYRVRTITESSVTLVGPAGTNVLRLGR